MPPEVAAASAPPAEVRECLERVLASPFFASRRRGELLKYLVERTLAGEAAAIGEYAVALDVFGKPESFDPRSESTVRAEMSRLRRGLADYYSHDGAKDALRFEFPARGYVPAVVRTIPPPVEVRPRARKRRTLWAFAALSGAGLTAVLIAVLILRARTVGPVRSVAVLPFANLTGDPHNDFLGDGISEGLTDSLARVDSLRVVARTSSFQFRGRAKDVREIGRQLNADAVVEGSIRKQGGNLAVTVQVNRSVDGFHILSRVFEAKPSDLGRIERDMAAPVLAVLRPGLRPAPQRIPDPDAWALVLKAHIVRMTPTLDAFNQTVALLNEAIRRDPQYAAAWGELASTYAAAAVNLHVDEKAAANMAKSAARRALEFDPASSSAWAAQGLVDAMVFLQWQQGEEELRRALALAPQDAVVHQRLCSLLMLNGRFGPAREECRKAEELDPLAANPGLSLGLIAFMERRYDAALAKWSAVAALHPDMKTLHAYIGSAFDALGEYDRALAEYRVAAPDGSPLIEPRILLVLAHEGRLSEARQRLARYAASSDSDPFSLAVVYGALGDRDRAFASLEEAWHHRNCWMLKVYPPLDPLRSDPRYETFLKRAGFER